MFVPKVLAYLKGFLVITVTGNFTERFINVCAAQNILLWDITRISAKTIRCKISVRGFKKLIKIAYNTGVTVKINTKHGFPFFLKRYKKRKILLSSVFLLILFMIIINQFVWEIEIRGNETVKSADILQALYEEGLKIGIPKAKIDQTAIKNSVIIKLPSLSWLWINKDGSKIIVDVRERIPTPEIFNPNDYCNVVAQKDAVIDSMVVRNGIPVVSVGDTVLKDTVLITGKIPASLKPEIRYEQADAEVYARVWYQKTERFPTISIIKNRTGKKRTLSTLKLFGLKIPLFHNGTSPYENFEKTEKKYELSLFQNYLGISLFTDTFYELNLTEEKNTDESVAMKGASILKKQIDDETVSDSVLVSVEDSYTKPDEMTVEVTVRAEYIEDIAVKVKGEILEEERILFENRKVS